MWVKVKADFLKYFEGTSYDARTTGKIVAQHESGFKSVGSPKYLRKFAFDEMIELEIPESTADFNEGRVPHRTGAKHYLALAKQSSKFYEIPSLNKATERSGPGLSVFFPSFHSVQHLYPKYRFFLHNSIIFAACATKKGI